MAALKLLDVIKGRRQPSGARARASALFVVLTAALFGAAASGLIIPIRVDNGAELSNTVLDVTAQALKADPTGNPLFPNNPWFNNNALSNAVCLTVADRLGLHSTYSPNVGPYIVRRLTGAGWEIGQYINSTGGCNANSYINTLNTVTVLYMFGTTVHRVAMQPASPATLSSGYGSFTATSTGTSCGQGITCRNAWQLVCNGQLVHSVNNETLVVSYGDGGASLINTLSAGGSTQCNLTLSAIDNTQNTLVTSVTRVFTVPELLPPVPVMTFDKNLGISGYPEVAAGSSITTTSSGTCPNGGCNAGNTAFKLHCLASSPSANDVVLLNKTGIQATWSTGTGSVDIRMTSLLVPRVCNVTITVGPDNAGLLRSSSAAFEVLSYPVPVAALSFDRAAGSSGYPEVEAGSSITANSSGTCPNGGCTDGNTAMVLDCKESSPTVGDAVLLNATGISTTWYTGIGAADIIMTGIKVPRVCNVTIVVGPDAGGMMGSSTATFQVKNFPSPVVAIVLDKPVGISGDPEVGAGSNITMNASVACPNGGCTASTTHITLKCPASSPNANNAVLLNKTDTEATWSTGVGSADINMLGVGAPRVCNITVTTGPDNFGMEGSAAANFQVLPQPPVCPPPGSRISPSSVKSLPVSTTCKANQNFLRNITEPNGTRNPTNPYIATLTRITDLQGFSAVFNITSVRTNRKAAVCSCRPSRDVCTCLPEVTVLGNGTLRFMRVALLLGPVRGRLFRISYTAMVPETGLYVDCTADLCSILNGNAARPPSCKPFEAGDANRSALEPTCPRIVGAAPGR